MYYVYEWYIEDTNEIIYVGKGSKKRYLSKQHNQVFKYFIVRYSCKSRIIKYFDNEQDAYEYEFERVNELKSLNQCVCNINIGGSGGGASRKTKMTRWANAEREKYSKYNVMKSSEQRERMSKNNPMKIKEYAMKNGLKHRKPFYIGKVEYQTLQEASDKYNKPIQTIKYWLCVGHNTYNEQCFYKHGNQQPSTNLNDL